MQTLSIEVVGRYVKLIGTNPATSYGYSLYEIEVYNGLFNSIKATLIDGCTVNFSKNQ